MKQKKCTFIFMFLAINNVQKTTSLLFFGNEKVTEKFSHWFSQNLARKTLNLNDFFCLEFQMGYNLLWRSAEYEVLPICKENNVGILAYSPLQQGLLTGRFATVADVPLGRKRGKLFSPERSVMLFIYPFLCIVIVMPLT